MPFIVVPFTKNGSPQLGLSPDINIYRVSDNVLIVSAGAMLEIADGLYKFNFTAGVGFVVGVEYAFRGDGGVALGTPNRYVFGTSVLGIDEITSEVSDFSVVQGWVRSITSPPGDRFRSTFALHQNGEFQPMAGAARLAVEVFDDTATSVLSQTDIAPNAEGFFVLEEDPFAFSQGRMLAARATVTTSGLGTGTHVSILPLAVADQA